MSDWFITKTVIEKYKFNLEDKLKTVALPFPRQETYVGI